MSIILLKNENTIGLIFLENLDMVFNLEICVIIWYNIDKYVTVPWKSIIFIFIEKTKAFRYLESSLIGQNHIH